MWSHLGGVHQRSEWGRGTRLRQGPGSMGFPPKPPLPPPEQEGEGEQSVEPLDRAEEWKSGTRAWGPAGLASKVFPEAATSRNKYC